MKSRVLLSTQQNRSLPLVQGIILLNYLIIPNHLQKEPSNTFRLGMFGKELYAFFFPKYNELSCGSSLFKSRLSGRPRNKEDAARTRRPPQMARLSCCHAPTSSGQSGRLPVTDTVHNPHHSLKVADSYLKTKHNELL